MLVTLAKQLCNWSLSKHFSVFKVCEMRKVYLVLFVVIANACGIAGESLASKNEFILKNLPRSQSTNKNK